MAGFLITCLKVHKSVENMTSVIIICFIIQALGTLMIGPSYLLRRIIPDSLIVIVIGLFLIGLAGSYTSIGAYTEMYEPYVKINPSCNKDQLSDILSGLYNAGFSLGTIVGPMAGSYITIGYNSFGVCTDYFAITAVLFSGLTLFFVVK